MALSFIFQHLIRSPWTIEDVQHLSLVANKLKIDSQLCYI